MKKTLSYLVAGVLLVSACTPSESTKKEEITYVSFGEKITADNSISQEEMGEKFKSLQAGDTIEVKFASTVNAVCQKKGCWVEVPIGGDQTSFVKFKDYAFFMPFNSAGSEIILNGKAFVREISVKQLQHYAKDAGKSEEEIEKITEPERTFSFVADGVLLEASKNEEK